MADEGGGEGQGQGGIAAYSFMGSTKDSDDPISLLSGSGFPFQTAVATAIRRTGLFDVREEVAWNSPNGSSGFIDLVASTLSLRICIECKSLRNDNLIFLIPSKPAPQQTADLDVVFVNLLRDSRGALGLPVVSHGTATASPASHASMYCVARSSEKKGRLIEHDLQPLVRASETHAIDMVRGFSSPQSVMFVPVFVTTAKLNIAVYDASAISLADGIYKPRADDISEVPCIRFTKEFAHTKTSQTRMRTVIVVQATYLVELMRGLGEAYVPQGGSTNIYNPQTADLARIMYGRE